MRTLDDNATVAERIRFYRTKRNMNSNVLAELVGLSRYAIMRYENGQTEPSLADLKKIAVVLSIEPDKLYDDYYRFLDYPYHERVKRIRKEHCLSREELGAMLGIVKGSVERWEHGRHVISRATWERLCALGLL